MALLDRLRTSPDKNPDPASRLAWVEGLPMDQRDLIADVARQDPDARVRRAAVAKLLEPAALAVVARDDDDDSVRAKAVEMLRDLALDAFEGTEEGAGLAAVEGIADAKTLAQVAKSAAREPVARLALARVTEPRMLGSIARHAVLEPVRRAALERVQDPPEIVAIALNSEFKDSAAAAVERVADRAALDQICARAKNKAAAKRARAILQQMDEGASQEAAMKDPATEVAAAWPDQPEIAHGGHNRELVEALASNEDLAAAEDGLGDADAGWAPEVQAPDADLAARFATAEAVFDDRAASAPEEEAAREDATAPAEPETPPTGDGKEEARRQTRLLELAAEAEEASADPDLSAARRRLSIAHREWQDLLAGHEAGALEAARLAAAEERLAARETAVQDASARARREALNQLQQLVRRADLFLAKPDMTVRAGERALRDIRAALGEMPPLPSRQHFEELTEQLKAALAALVPKVQELREAEDWKRFGNVALQEQLIARMQALVAVDDPQKVAHEIRHLQQQWRLAADVPRAQAEGLWRRFKAAHDEAWARCEAHFAAQATERADNLARKTALCERVEVLADSTRWIETAEAIKQLQAEWKTIGPVTRGSEKAVWERFCSACDRFFARRHEDLANRKKVWAENLAKKEALCARAEALADSSDWDATAASLKQLQAEWKTIGPVKKTRSEAIWQRFRVACDRFFDRYGHRHETERVERVAAREAVCAELEALVSPEADAEPPANLLLTVRAIRARWNQAVLVRGVDREQAMALEQRFGAAFDAAVARWPAIFQNTDLDPQANQRRMESLVKRMEDLAASVRQPAPSEAALSSTTRLATMLKEALAANTIGGRVDDDSRWRAAADDVRQAQASWARIGPAPDEARRTLGERFQRACRLIVDAAVKAGRTNASKP